MSQQQLIHTYFGDMTPEEVDELLECGTKADKMWTSWKQMDLQHAMTDRDFRRDKSRDKTMLS